ncbi:hypothetical protein DSECCO2_485080 [anaerobic digester metagenome]
MTSDELFFFNTKPRALPLYAALAERMLAAFPNVTVEVKKTQITFRERYSFAFVSLRKMKGCPEVFIIVSPQHALLKSSFRPHKAASHGPSASSDVVGPFTLVSFARQMYNKTNGIRQAFTYGMCNAKG